MTTPEDTRVAKLEAESLRRATDDELRAECQRRELNCGYFEYELTEARAERDAAIKRAEAVERELAMLDEGLRAVGVVANKRDGGGWALTNGRAVVAEAEVASLAAQVGALRESLATVRDVLRAEIQMPHVCSDCGWQVGGVPKGLHNFGCRVANAVDSARDVLDATTPPERKR